LVVVGGISSSEATEVGILRGTSHSTEQAMSSPSNTITDRDELCTHSVQQHTFIPLPPPKN
jgi:hypothetical protein